MKQFLSLAYKEMLHILRDPLTVTLVLIMPTVLTVLFSYTVSVDLRNINVVVTAQHPTDKITNIVARMEHSQYFTVLGNTDNETAQDMLRSGKADAIVNFRSQTAAIACVPEIQVLLDGSNTIKAQNADSYIRALIMSSWHDSSAEKKGTRTTSSTKTMPEFHVRMVFNPELQSSFSFVPGIMGVIFLLICCIMTSCSIVKEKEMGSMRLLLVSPARPANIILAKLLPYVVISMIDLVAILAISYYMVGIPMRGNLFLLVNISILYILLSLALGMVVSTICKTQVQALMTSALTMLMPVILFSGMVYPIENMPQWLQPVCLVIPARWYIDALRKIMIEGIDTAGIATDILSLCCITVVLIALSLSLFKVKNQ